MLMSIHHFYKQFLISLIILILLIISYLLIFHSVYLTDFNNVTYLTHLIFFLLIIIEYYRQNLYVRPAKLFRKGVPKAVVWKGFIKKVLLKFSEARTSINRVTGTGEPVYPKCHFVFLINWKTKFKNPILRFCFCFNKKDEIQIIDCHFHV